MKCQVPQISWHSRDPVLSIDFQPIQGDLFRLASGGTDSHVLIWYITYEENKSVKYECASDLYRHNKSVNVVRFSPNGQLLASGDDEGAMFIWELKDKEQIIDLPNEDENVNKEEWYPVKLLRGHLDDIYDICWSKDGNFLVSASMDNTTIIWDMQKYVKVHIFSDFKGYVQGVTWDPCNQFIASVGSDRTLRIHNINSRKCVSKTIKAPWTNSTEKGTFKARLFYDDTLQSYFRRLTFTPDGEFLIVPSGILEKGEKIINSCFLFSRYMLNKPVISLPTGDKYTVAVKCNPFLYKLRRSHDVSDKENAPPKPMLDLPYRMIFAVAASDSVLMYDTEQLLPFAYVSNIHYTHLTDLTWSPDGLTLVVSSTDGYCSFILFTKDELGEIYVPEVPKIPEKESEPSMNQCKTEKMDTSQTESTVVSVEKDPKICSSPPSSTSETARSPKSAATNTKDGSVTPTSKVKISSENKKSTKKSPKMISIKNFFISPKAVATGAVSDASKASAQESSKSGKITSATDVPAELITISDSPVKNPPDSKSSDNAPIKNDAEIKSPIITPTTEPEAMDVDEMPDEEHIPEASTEKSGKQSKCKVRLDFVDKVASVVNDDNACDSLSADSPPDETKSSNKRKAMDEDENDWKLELSQDEEIAPIKVESTASEISSGIPMSFELKSVSKPAVTSSVDETTKVTNPPETKVVTKKRVAFVTLSSKPTFKK